MKLTEEAFYIADFRRQWLTRPYISFWRPENAGYAYPLSWAGRYERGEIIAGYHTRNEAGRIERCAVPCHLADALAVLPAPGQIDGDAGPVVENTAENRKALRAGRALLQEPDNG